MLILKVFKPQLLDFSIQFKGEFPKFTYEVFASCNPYLDRLVTETTL